MSEKGASDVRLKAYSLLKIADAIEEASTSKTQEVKGSNISNFMRILEEEQQSILGLVRSSLSDLATVPSVASRDSSEIPFDERSQSLASLASGQGMDSPVPQTDTRDDTQGETTTRQQAESDERARAEPTTSAHLPTLPYSNEKRAELSRSLGPYLYSKIHSAHDRSEHPFISICHSSSFLEPPSCDSQSDNPKLDESKKIQPALLLSAIKGSSSDDSDDTIGKLREFAESTFDASTFDAGEQTSFDSETVSDAANQGSTSAPSTPRVAIAFDSLEPPSTGSSQARERSVKRASSMPWKSRKSLSEDSDDQGSIGSNASIEVKLQLRKKGSKANSKPPPRPPKASRKHLQKQETKKVGKARGNKQCASQRGEGPQDAGECRIPKSPRSSSARERSKSPSQAKRQVEAQDPKKESSLPLAASTLRARWAQEQQKHSNVHSLPKEQPKACRLEPPEPQNSNNQGDSSTTRPASSSRQKASQEPENHSKEDTIPTGPSNIAPRYTWPSQEASQTKQSCQHQIAVLEATVDNFPGSWASTPRMGNRAQPVPIQTRLHHEQQRDIPDSNQDKLPGASASTTRSASILGSTPEAIPATHPKLHQGISPERSKDHTREREGPSVNPLVEQLVATSMQASMQALEKRQQGRLMFSRIKSNTKISSNKASKLEMQVNNTFTPATSLSQDEGIEGIEPALQQRRRDRSSAPRPQTSDQSIPNTKVMESSLEQSSDLIGSEQHQEPVLKVKAVKEDRSIEEDTTHNSKQDSQATDDTKVNESERMLKECYSAIVSLKETSESKYQALESKYLELKGSFSHLETHNQHMEDGNQLKENFEFKNELLESRQREMQTTIAKLEENNHQLLEETDATKSKHESLMESVAHLENQNRRLTQSAVEHEDKSLELQKENERLQEQNSQLQVEVELTRKLESQCESIEGRCAELQKGFSNLEDQNTKLREENIDLQTKLQEVEDERQQLEEACSRQESQASQDRTLDAKCQQLDEDKGVLHNEKQQIQLKLQAMEAKCLVLEDSNDQLKSRVSVLQDEKYELQSKFQVIECRCKELEESSSQTEGHQGLLQDERHQFQSKLLGLESKYQALVQESSALKDVHDEKLELQSKLRIMEAKIRELDESNPALTSEACDVQDQKLDLQSKLKMTEAKLHELEELKSEACNVQDQKLELQSKLQTMEATLQELEELEPEACDVEDGKLESQPRLQAMDAKIQELEESNSALKSEACDLQDEKLELQSRLQSMSTKMQELEDFYSQVKAQNFQLQSVQEHLKSNLLSIESKGSELERSNESLAAQKLEMEQMKEGFETKLQSMETKCLELEQSNCHLKAHNMEVSDINESLKATQTSLEGNLQEARKHIRDLACLNHLKNPMSPNRQMNSTSETRSSEAESVIISCISSETLESGDKYKSNDTQGKTGYEVVSSQDLLSNASSNKNKLQPASEEEDHSNSLEEDRVIDLGSRDQNFDEQLRDKLSELASFLSSEEDQVLEKQSENSTEGLSHKEQASQINSADATPKDTVDSSLNGDGGMVRQSVGRVIAWGGQSQRTLPPLSPRPLPSPRPPLPPNTPRQSNIQESEEPQQIRNDQGGSLETSISGSSSLSDALEERVRDAPQTPRKAQREQTPSSILLDLMHEPSDEGNERRYIGREVEVPSPPDQHPWRSRKDSDEANSPDHSKRSRKSGGRHPEPRLGKSSSSSQVMATLFGSDEDPKVIPEYESPVEHVPYDAMVPSAKREAVPLIPNFLDSQASRTPLRHKPDVRDDADSSRSSCEEESNSIVTQTSTHTRDLLNTPSRKAKKMFTKHLERPVVKSTANKLKKPRSPCDWFVPVEFDPQSPPQDLPVTQRTNVGLQCDPSGCGVEAILPSSCSSILARRTWNYGKKQSRVTNSQHLISNSEHSSIVSVTSNPTATTTILVGTECITTAHKGGTTSFESPNTSSDNGSTISSKFSPILAKREKLRRKQGQSTPQSANSSISSKPSEKQGLKADKKILLRPLAGGGTFPFL